MLLSHTDILVIIAVVDIAIHGQERPVPAGDIAPRHSLPERYLEPMLRGLVGSGILTSKPGRRGGYQLARAPSLITVNDILRAVRTTQEVALRKVRSLIGRRVVIPALNDAQMAFSRGLQRITIHDLVRSAERAS